MAAVADAKGLRTVALDTSALTDVTDHMVVVSGSSRRHVRAIVARVEDAVKRHGIKPLGVEGRNPGDWVLIDLADVLVHVMGDEARAFYDLEGLWQVAGAPERLHGEAPAGRAP